MSGIHVFKLTYSLLVFKLSWLSCGGKYIILKLSGANVFRKQASRYSFSATLCQRPSQFFNSWELESPKRLQPGYSQGWVCKE